MTHNKGTNSEVFKASSQYVYLDLIRGIAALAVFAGHLRIICFRDVNISTLDLLGKGVFFLTGFGHLAVILFFVLSGFLIIKSINESVIKKKWSVKTYGQNRLFRLWIVLIPCLLIGLILDRIGIEYWGDSLFYSNQWKYFYNQDISNKLTPSIFFGNLSFLQTILVPPLGSNSALWSLCNEFWYYVLFPLFYFAANRSCTLVVRIFLTFAGICVLFFIGSEIFLMFPIWLLGGFSYFIAKNLNKKHLQSKKLLILISSLFVMTLLMNRMKFHVEVFNFYIIAFFFSIAIPFLINSKFKYNVTRSISTYLSNISYTLYLSHLPFIYLLTSILHFQDELWSNTNFLIFMGVLALTMIYATCLWFLFERNTKKIKARLITLFSRLNKYAVITKIYPKY